MSDAMHTCLDTVVRMLVCRDAADACYSVRHAGLAPLPLSWKNVSATAVSDRWVHFQCPLGSLVCTTVHMVPMPPGKSGSAKAEYVSDTKTIMSCLDQALQRGSWNELSSFVVADTFTGLRINLTTDTNVDHEDEPHASTPAHVEHQVKRFAALSDKGRLAAKTTTLVRQAVEHHRSKEAQSAHIALAVAGQMARYRHLSLKA
jgi:hypothetical protein